MIKHLFTAALCVMLCLAGSINASIIYPTNDGFELPNLHGGTSFRAQNAAWTFNSPGGTGSTGSAPASGITSNTASLGAVNAFKTNLNGGASTTKGQAAFLEGGDGTLNSLNGAFFSQTIHMPSAGTLQVHFYEEGHHLNNAAFASVKVLLKQNNNTVNLGTSTPSSMTVFGLVHTPGTTVTAGDLVLYFVGITNNGDCDSITFIDNVSTTLTGSPVPEPGTFVLFGLGAIGMVVVARRRRRA